MTSVQMWTGRCSWKPELKERSCWAVAHFTSLLNIPVEGNTIHSAVTKTCFWSWKLMANWTNQSETSYLHSTAGRQREARPMVMTSWIKIHSHSVVLLQQLEGREILKVMWSEVADPWLWPHGWHIYRVAQYLLQQLEGRGRLQTHGHDLTDQQQDRQV